MKIAFVFPGQGSQNVGMGKDFYENFSEVKDIYNEASDVLGYDVAELSFNGPQEELNRTFRTQPCLLTASFAAFKVLAGKGISPVYVAGHSLGEYSAITASGAMSFKDAVKFTEKRGQLMQEAVPEGKGLMAAILGLGRDVINDVCSTVKSGYVAPANLNCPGQIVIAGEKPAVEEAIKLAVNAGARKAVPLAVSAPSHCKLMEGVSDELSEMLKSIDIQDPEIPVVNNADASFLKDAGVVRDSLVRQLNNPLLWEDSIKLMAENGVDTFIEVGPKKVLSGLIKRIDGNAKRYNVEDTETLDQTLSEIDKG
jgi:[acyl-carrier-protein] S-malonyltransferase